jgi:hypothetical protein
VIDRDDDDIPPFAEEQSVRAVAGATVEAAAVNIEKNRSLAAIAKRGCPNV